VEYCRQLSRYNIGYNDDFLPPGEKQSWTMDCSNTSRLIYKKVFGYELARVASSQYYELRQAKKYYAAPRKEDGDVDERKLFSKLHSGDLLFWEWTYDIKRTPPISHVMIYLGETKTGKHTMFGANSHSRGMYTANGGPDIYEFKPNAPMGGVRNFFGSYTHRGRFVGFARPIKQRVMVQTQSETNKQKPIQ
jgi:hypothetical protein